VSASEGQPGNDGSEASPFDTIQAAAEAVNPGDKVIVRQGVYYECVRMRQSGESDNFIEFEGERGPGGEWLSIIDCSEEVGGWQEAFDIGPGVYKTETLDYEPFAMVVLEDGDTRDIPHLDHEGDGYDWAQYIAYAHDQIVQTQYEGLDVNYWDGIEALYYSDGTATYIRFRDYDNPADKSIWAAARNYGTHFNGNAYVAVRNFHIRACSEGMAISGDSAVGNIVEDNYFTNGMAKIALSSGASDNHIRNNVMRMNGLSSFWPGAWGEAEYIDSSYVDERYDRAVKEHFYNSYKHEIGAGTSSPRDDNGITVSSAGSGNRIYQNHIYETLGGVRVFNTPDLYVYDNVIHNISSVCFFVENASNLQIHRNLLYECNLAIRFGSIDENDSVAYVYNNRFYNPRFDDRGVGSSTYIHTANNPPLDSPSLLWYYHNSYSGGHQAFSVSHSYREGGSLPGLRFVNNVISAQRVSSNYHAAIIDNAEFLGAFDYNWLGGGDFTPAWSGDNNKVHFGEYMWSAEPMPDFVLPADSDAREAGLDLSVPFQLDGESFDPLPGLEPGYYAGDAPDLGILQAQDPDDMPPGPPLNLTVR
jgi:hypothetical protein